MTIHRLTGGLPFIHQVLIIDTLMAIIPYFHLSPYVLTYTPTNFTFLDVQLTCCVLTERLRCLLEINRNNFNWTCINLSSIFTIISTKLTRSVWKTLLEIIWKLGPIMSLKKMNVVLKMKD